MTGRATRRGQLQALEPVVIVIVLVIIFAIGGVFFFRAAQHEQSVDARIIQNKDDEAMLGRMAWLPELSCGTGTNCIDLYKLQSFSVLLTNQSVRTSYYPIFGASSVSITWLAPEGPKTIILYDGLRSENVVVTRTYFTVYDPVMDAKYFATMTIKRGVQ